MTSKIRIEYVRPRRGGDAFGFSAQAVQQICDDAELLTITGVNTTVAIGLLSAIGAVGRCRSAASWPEIRPPVPQACP